MRSNPFPSRQTGFSLVELLVVIGLIGVLIAILMPALHRAREQAKMVQCASNMRQIGLAMLAYSNSNNGWLFPSGPGMGVDGPPPYTEEVRQARWPSHVLTPATWNNPILLCPADVEPAEAHSYILNQHLGQRNIRYSGGNLGGKSPDMVVVMGEKKSDRLDYYMDIGDFDTRVEKYRHGVKLGSNYLFLDMHVGITPPNEAIGAIDPWDPAPNTNNPSGGG
jgi:prepilin-type N-terminal cleavage/methylation domain-containing protein